MRICPSYLGFVANLHISYFEKLIKLAAVGSDAMEKSIKNIPVYILNESIAKIFSAIRLKI